MVKKSKNNFDQHFKPDFTPKQMLALFTLTIGEELTMTVTVSVALQLVPTVTTYVVVTFGCAIGFVQVTQLSPVEGDQLYVAFSGPVWEQPSEAVSPQFNVRSGPAFAHAALELYEGISAAFK